MEIDVSLLSHFFLGLVAIINPFGVLPVFVSLTNDMTKEARNKTAFQANIAVGIILICSMLVGQFILDTFHISIDAFQVAGGLLLLSIAFPMLGGKLGENKQNKQEKNEMSQSHINQIAIVPLAMPIMAGPAAISTSILYAANYPGWHITLLFSLVTILFCIGSWLLFLSAPLIVRIVGQTGINVITRLMGLLLSSIAIEMITAGLKVLFPGLN